MVMSSGQISPLKKGAGESGINAVDKFFFFH
jgi:hypothetical protein